MQTIDLLLKKYAHIRPPHDATRKAVIEVVQNTCGVRLDKNTITLNKGVVHIRTDAHTKHAIALRKQEVITKLGEALGVRQAPRDLR